MPEMHFHVRWPDGHESRCYSPSLVVRDHLRPGTRYALPDFLQRVQTALHTASSRVQAKYGYTCSLALGQLAAIEATAAAFHTSSSVDVLRFDPPEPAP